jgi:hypothetical protein
VLAMMENPYTLTKPETAPEIRHFHCFTFIAQNPKLCYAVLRKDFADKSALFYE